MMRGLQGILLFISFLFAQIVLRRIMVLIPIRLTLENKNNMILPVLESKELNH